MKEKLEASQALEIAKDDLSVLYDLFRKAFSSLNNNS